MKFASEDRDKPLLMISAVAEMVAVHPQTLRVYERVGLIGPKRTPGKKRLYSYRDVEILRFIQVLTRDRGVNLAGVKVILDLQNEINTIQRDMKKTIDGLMQRFNEKSDPLRETGLDQDQKDIRIKIEDG